MGYFLFLMKLGSINSLCNFIGNKYFFKNIQENFHGKIKITLIFYLFYWFFFCILFFRVFSQALYIFFFFSLIVSYSYECLVCYLQLPVSIFCSPSFFTFPLFLYLLFSNFMSVFQMGTILEKKNCVTSMFVK